MCCVNEGEMRARIGEGAGLALLQRPTSGPTSSRKLRLVVLQGASTFQGSFVSLGNHLPLR
jgi:hypothetical protein